MIKTDSLAMTLPRQHCQVGLTSGLTWVEVKVREMALLTEQRVTYTESRSFEKRSCSFGRTKLRGGASSFWRNFHDSK